jgi:hypothetical protein
VATSCLSQKRTGVRLVPPTVLGIATGIVIRGDNLSSLIGTPVGCPFCGFSSSMLETKLLRFQNSAKAFAGNNLNMGGQRADRFRKFPHEVQVQVEDIDLSHISIAMSRKWGKPGSWRGGKVFSPLLTNRREELTTMPGHSIAKR